MYRIALVAAALVLVVQPSIVQALKLTPLPMKAAANSAQPSIVSDNEDGFILTWQQRSDSGASLHFAQLDGDGQVQHRGVVARSTTEHPWFVNWADFPSLAVLDNGDWVTFWLQKRSPATYAYDVHLTRSTDRGRSWSEPLIVHRDATASEHGFVSLVPAGEDRVLAIWLDGRNMAADATGHGHGDAPGAAAMTLRSAIVDRAENISDEAEIDARTCDCCSTDAARMGDETLLIYRDRSVDEIRDMQFSVRGRMSAWSQPRLVHADGWKIAGCPVNGPALAVNGRRALAVWTTMHGEALSVRAAIGGMRGFGPMIELEHGARTLGRVDAASWGRSRFLVSWVGADLMPEGNMMQSPETEVTTLRLDVLDHRAKIAERAVLATFPKGSNPGTPRIATSGKNAIAVWTESDQGVTAIRAVLIQP